MIKLLSLWWKVSGNTPAAGHSGREVSRSSVGIRQLNFGGLLAGIGSALGRNGFLPPVYGDRSGHHDETDFFFSSHRAEQ